MQIEELRQLADWMREAELSELNLSGSTVEVRMHRAVHPVSPVELTPALAIAPPAVEIVASSFCGHFYRRSPRGADPMIADERLVAAGDPIGIIEVGELSLPVVSVACGVAQSYLVEDG
ncbi:hypothetical protein [Pseudomonas taiwanensis]|uniref:Biotin carboxyl carrier protein n=1 Tax=Pseudomonas taiwanensis TaxID=470150 RepID=A0ABR6V5L3_9PSED|nr:hypothetical protein [Pseudomonas taiwanensis]MBC3475789.1 hypothetical protein [Pseudomonas taiwanensis]